MKNLSRIYDNIARQRKLCLPIVKEAPRKSSEFSGLYSALRSKQPGLRFYECVTDRTLYLKEKLVLFCAFFFSLISLINKYQTYLTEIFLRLVSTVFKIKH